MSVNTGRYRPERNNAYKKRFGQGENVPRLVLSCLLSFFTINVNVSDSKVKSLILL